MTESRSPWRALPWVAVGSIPLIVHLVIQRLANRAVYEATTVGIGPYRAGAANTKTQFHSPPSHMLVRMVVLTMMTLIGVVQSRTWSCPFAVPASCRPTLDRIVLVPIGPIDPSVMQSLVHHFRDCYSLPISLGQPIEISSSAYDSQRKQWIVENLLDAIPGCKTEDSSCDHALTIGITDYDIYMLQYAKQFNWIYTARNDERHVEVVSIARMGGFDAHPDHAFKIVARDIALDYCNLPISKNPQSVLTPTLSGGDALDRIDESIW